MRNKTLSWYDAQKLQENHEGEFIYNSLHEIVAIKIVTASKLNQKTGSTIAQYKLIRPTHSQAIDEENYQNSSWQSIDEAECQRLWQLEVSQEPVEIEKFQYVVSGLILPLWNQLGNGNLKIYRIVDSQTGESILGRLIANEEVKSIYSSLNKEITLEPDVIVECALSGQTVTVNQSKTWKLKKSKVAYKNRLEIIGWQPKDLELLQHYGCFEETIAWKIRCFVPLNKATAIVTELNKI